MFLFVFFASRLSSCLSLCFIHVDTLVHNDENPNTLSESQYTTYEPNVKIISLISSAQQPTTHLYWALAHLLIVAVTFGPLFVISNLIWD